VRLPTYHGVSEAVRDTIGFGRGCIGRHGGLARALPDDTVREREVVSRTRDVHAATGIHCRVHVPHGRAS